MPMDGMQEPEAAQLEWPRTDLCDPWRRRTGAGAGGAAAVGLEPASRAGLRAACCASCNGDARKPHAALLDLREGFTQQDLAEFGTALSAGNVGWVAGIDARQLDEPPVRDLIRDYCYDYLTLPCPEAVLNTVIGHAHGMASLACERGDTTSEAGFDGMIGESPAMRALCRTLRKAALTEAPVFIAGETGTGKELAAMAVHRHSRRHAHPFVAINCGAIPHSLIQSELFGYERGAFTGAQQRKLGRIEMANGGTLFLDEIGDLPLESQASLLRFLQQGSIERLGGHEQIPRRRAHHLGDPPRPGRGRRRRPLPRRPLPSPVRAAPAAAAAARPRQRHRSPRRARAAALFAGRATARSGLRAVRAAGAAYATPGRATCAS